MHAVVAARGQVTIPRRLRERLGIAPQTVLDFEEENGRLVAVKVAGPDPVRKVLGCLRSAKRTDRLVTELRGEP